MPHSDCEPRYQPDECPIARAHSLIEIGPAQSGQHHLERYRRDLGNPLHGERERVNGRALIAHAWWPSAADISPQLPAKQEDTAFCSAGRKGEMRCPPCGSDWACRHSIKDLRMRNVVA